MSWIAALLPESKIGADSVGDLAKELADRDQNVRRRATDRLIRSIRGAENDARTGRALRKLIAALSAARATGLREALRHKGRHGDAQMYLHIVPPRKSAVDPLHKELDALLNALEWDLQRHAAVDLECPGCREVNHTTAAAASVHCVGCAETVPVVRWLFSSRGQPVVFLLGEFAYRADGSHLGNLEGNQVWTMDYKGEVVFDDRFMHDRSKDARHRHKLHLPGQPPPVAPPPPRPKSPLRPEQILGGTAELKRFSDDF